MNVDHLDNLPYYEQDSGPNITYQFLVKPGTLGLMSSGRVRAKGPTEKALDTHTGWDQIYLILSGSGTIIVGDDRHRVSQGNVVRIPKGTLHGIVLDDGEEIEYVYVNAFKDDATLKAWINR